MIKITAVLSLVLFTFSNSFAKSVFDPSYIEPQSISPNGDAEFLMQFIFDPMDENDVTRNYLFIAQDKRGPNLYAKRKTHRVSDGELNAAGLASRGDIVMVLSVNKKTKKWVVFSFYRGMKVPNYCFGKQLVGLTDEEKYLANFYLAGGRRYFLPCIENMMRERIKANPELEQYGLSKDFFVINGFFEGTKENTIKPLAIDIKDTVLSFSNLTKFVWIYGRAALFKGLAVIMNTEDIKLALEGKVDANSVGVNTRQLYVEAKERNAYKSAGYQRAYNFAKMTADFLGWVAYGVNQDPEIWKLFEESFNKHFSRSHDLTDFISDVSQGNENLLKYANYNNESSQVDVVQFGISPKEFALLKGEKLQIHGSNDYLRNLRTDVRILPAAPSTK